MVRPTRFCVCLCVVRFIGRHVKCRLSGWRSGTCSVLFFIASSPGIQTTTTYILLVYCCLILVYRRGLGFRAGVAVYCVLGNEAEPDVYTVSLTISVAI